MTTALTCAVGAVTRSLGVARIVRMLGGVMPDWFWPLLWAALGVAVLFGAAALLIVWIIHVVVRAEFEPIDVEGDE